MVSSDLHMYFLGTLLNVELCYSAASKRVSLFILACILILLVVQVMYWLYPLFHNCSFISMVDGNLGDDVVMRHIFIAGRKFKVYIH
jgi:hypothetical protein